MFKKLKKTCSTLMIVADNFDSFVRELPYISYMLYFKICTDYSTH